MRLHIPCAHEIVRVALDGGRFIFAAAGLGGQIGHLILHGLRRLQLAGKEQLHHAVHHQIGIAPYGRCEVAVVARGQRVMPQRLVAVLGALERAQHEALDHRLLRRSGHASQHALQDLRLRVASQMNRMAEYVQEVLQHGELVSVRPFMDAVEQRQLRFARLFGNRLVGGQHKILNQPLSFAAHARLNVGRLALFVQREARLGQLEIDRAALLPLCPHAASQRVHLEERFMKLLGHAVFRAIQQFVHLGVGQARPRMDDGTLKMRRNDLVALNLHEQRQ